MRGERGSREGKGEGIGWKGRGEKEEGEGEGRREKGAPQSDSLSATGSCNRLTAL